MLSCDELWDINKRNAIMRLVEALESRRLFADYTAANTAEMIAAITAANNAAEADTIVLAAGATFLLTAADNADLDGPSGLPVIAASGGELAIFGNGATIERSTATGTPGFRLFAV